jgi:hypothetical protein
LVVRDQATSCRRPGVKRGTGASTLCAARQSNTRTEDVLHIIRKRTTIDPSGREHESRTRYFVVDAVEAFGRSKGAGFVRDG